VLAALGLDPGLDLLNLDLLGQGSDPAALEAQKAAAMIANLVSSAEGAAGAGAGTESALVGALADLIADTGPGETVDLTDTATLTPLLTEALPGVTNVSTIANEVAAESETIAAATSIDGISDAQLDATLIDYSLNNDIVGDAGANHLFGFGGNDKLSGLGGNDILEGGSGFDFLWGGSGNDIFVAENSAAKEQTKVGTLSLDVVFDFAAGDKIDLRDIDANAALSGDQVFNFRGTNANKLAGDLSYKVFDSVMGAERALGHDIDGVTGASPYSGPVTIVYGNVDGGTADFAIALIGVNGVKASDFLFALLPRAAVHAARKKGAGSFLNPAPFPQLFVLVAAVAVLRIIAAVDRAVVRRIIGTVVRLRTVDVDVSDVAAKVGAAGEGQVDRCLRAIGVVIGARAAAIGDAADIEATAVALLDPADA
jgi:hypothetical protein